ncbi:MAG: hypothetical protein AAF829_03160 [Pseudomonadota bacterium]
MVGFENDYQIQPKDILAMCLPLDRLSLLGWLKTQVRVVEAWREDLARQPDIDLAQVQRIERHYQWLTGEIIKLEAVTPQAA